VPNLSDRPSGGRWVLPRPSPLLRPVGGRDSVIPYTHQGGSIIDESEIPFLSTRDKYHHPVYAKYTVNPQPADFVTVAAPASRRPGIPKPRLDAATRKAMAAAPSKGAARETASRASRRELDSIVATLCGVDCLVTTTGTYDDLGEGWTGWGATDFGGHC
jgi:hypothetical protein